jgi:hypothetical protein
MKIRQLVIAAVVLAALAATLYWSNRRKPTEDANAAAGAPVKIFSLNRDDVSKVEIKKKGGDDVVVSKAGPDNWKITSPQSLNADQVQISTVLSTLSVIDADRVIEEKAGDLKIYGLAEPFLAVSATTSTGAPQSLLIGDDTPAGSSVYAMHAGDPRVFTVSSYTKTSLDKGVKDLRDKRLLPVDFEKVSSVELTGPKLSLTLGSDNGQWAIHNPKDIRGDSSKLEGIVTMLRSATMDPSAPDEDRKKAASAFSTGSPLGTVKVAEPSGSYQLQIRKNKDAYYGKSTAMEGAYKIANELGETMGKNLDDFREKKLLDLAGGEPGKIEMHSGPKSYFLTRSGEDWWSDGKKMDPISVEAFLSAIRQLSATKFASSGFSNPAVTLTATSMDGKRVENIRIAKDGARAIAKRENDPLLYEFDAKSIDEMQKSADEMKIFEAPKK